MKAAASEAMTTATVAPMPRHTGGMNETSGTHDQELAIAAISRILLEGMPPGADHVVLTADVISTVTRAHYLAVYASGEQAAFTPGKPVDDESLDALRDAMYRDDVGTWFGMQFVQYANGRPSVQFNHDVDLGLPATADDWQLDLDVYPRSPANIPPWLAARLLG